MVKCTREVAENIIKQIFAGKSLKVSLEEAHVGTQDFFDLKASIPVLDEMYSRAQRSRAELLVEEIIDISDNEPDANRARVRTDARKWYASKMQPQKYGDRLDVNLNTTVDISAALVEARKRMLPLRDLSNVVDVEVIESIQLEHAMLTGSEPVNRPIPCNEVEPDIFD